MPVRRPALDLGTATTGANARRAASGGRDHGGRFRATRIAVQDVREWKLAGVDLGPAGTPPATPRGPRRPPADT
jgi:hypothetical protein